MTISNQTGTGTAYEEAQRFAQRGMPVFPIQVGGKIPFTGTHGFKDASTDLQQLAQWNTQYPNANWALATGAASGVFVLDIDPKNGGDATLEEQLLLHGPLPDTAEVLTGGGGNHYLFKHDPEHPTQPVSNVGGLPGIDIRDEAAYVVIAGSIHPSGRAYMWEASSHPDEVPLADIPQWILDAAHKPKAAPTGAVPGQRDVKLPLGSRALRFLATGVPLGQQRQEAVAAARNLHSAGYSVEDAADKLWQGFSNCEQDTNNPWTYSHALAIAQDIALRPAPPLTPLPEKPQPRDFDARPKPMDEAAYHGILGRLVKAIAPTSEANREMLLAHALIFAGNALGRSPHIDIGKRHGTNLFAMCVGKSAKARKGSAEGPVRGVFKDADPGWYPRISAGLSSGEGVAYHIRDPQGEEAPIDRRLLAVEQELASVLKRMGQQGNSLSAMMRTAWDGDMLSTLTKGSPLRSSDPHLSVIAHITGKELATLIDSTSLANGLANRFLICHAYRTQELPFGGALDDNPAIPGLVQELRDALDVGRHIGRVRHDKQASAVWEYIYSELSRDRPGIVGQVTNRAEAQVLRLSLLYAVMDGSELIRNEHLAAASAVWDYCEASARYVFGETLGDKDAEEIRSLVRGFGPLTKTNLHGHKGNNWQGERLSKALQVLLDGEWIEKEEKDGLDAYSAK